MMISDHSISFLIKMSLLTEIKIIFQMLDEANKLSSISTQSIITLIRTD